jgi:uncharacterized membrane protein YraQ (UPF0718 family)
MKNKNLAVISIVAGLVMVVLAGILIYNAFQKNSNIDDKNSQIIGGDKDEGGCLIGAGYSWCASKNKCLRVWEESCSESFCLRENVQAVYECGDYVKVTSSLLGGGNNYFSNSMIEINCPIVSPDYITNECKILSQLDCREINCSQ